MRLILLRTCTCWVISHLYRNKLGVAERGEEVPGGGGGPGRRSGRRGSSPASRGRAFFGGFLCRSSRYKKVQFYCRSAGRKRALSLRILDNVSYVPRQSNCLYSDAILPSSPPAQTLNSASLYKFTSLPKYIIYYCFEIFFFAKFFLQLFSNINFF